MLQIAQWKVTLILLTVLAAIVISVPNLFPASSVASWPGWVPRSQVVLGLDLQGGAYLLYEVDRTDYVERRLRTLLRDVRTAMLEGPRFGYTGLAIQGEGVQLRLRELDRLDEARQRLEPLRNPLDTSLFAAGSIFEFDLIVNDDGLVRLTYSEAGMAQRVRSIISQSIEVINRRINELGTTEPSIQRQGDDRILVEAPGVGDPERLKQLVGQTAQMNFHMVQRSIGTDQAAQLPPELGTVRFAAADNPAIVYEVDDVPLMTGEDLVDAQTAFHPDTNAPIVNFRLTTGGARKFADITSANVNQFFAIVLDDEVISAPRIQEPILGGSGQITGQFTLQEANDLAILLRAGSLPAKLTIIEERSVGPGLGADSIEAGQIASVIGTVGVAAFMFGVYGFFGAIAILAVLVNLLLIVAVITILGATLTLPGIAGIVLTVGMAVDSNVLIYERIREEFRQGRTAIAAIDLGFKRALATILDANITTMIAALVLFQFGTGPIRGFAIISAIGILTTVFTAFTFTRMVVALWVAWRRPKTVPI